jgi:small subunit ribosomal protein S2
MEAIGSTQNRDTAFQPHHPLHKPESASTVSLKHLLASAAHLGHAKERTDPAAYANVYGFRHGLAIIDPRETLTALRRAAAVLKGVVEQDGIVVFVGSPNRGIDRAVTENAKRLGPNGFAVLRWSPGELKKLLLPSSY